LVRIELIYDYPRLEERLIIERLKARGADVLLTNVNEVPLIMGESASEASVIRPVSMFKAAYAAAARESAGTYTVNNSGTIAVCGDKILCLSRIATKGVRIPRTAVAVDSRSAEQAFKLMPKPVVDKPPIGSWGRLVALVGDERVWKTILEYRSLLSSAQLKVHMLQQYVETGGRDVRTIVLGGEVLGAMERIGPPDDWRTNVALGGKTVQRRLDQELVEVSIKCAEVVGGDFVAVDILVDRSGDYYVNELNGVPEFKGFMEATGIDVAAHLAGLVMDRAKR